ncbi:MAG TPA: ComEC/Rec2 family competence protein, partial [Desulfosarcina sp.]|nr:ComEC/Rec2 family competence protein [Desulfosarcina sp.]
YLAGWALLNLKRTRLAPWLLSASLTLAAGDVLYWSHQRFWHSDLRVTAVDVGQGAATLMELPGGKVILYDGGGFADNRFFDMGRLVIAPLLWSRKIATVDVLVLSHPNADHLNGLIYVARHFAVRELWTNGDANTTWGYRELINVCRERSIAVKTLDRSHGKFSFDPVALEILHPPARSREHADALDQEDRNDLSLVLRAAYGRTAFLLTGDITARAEAMLVQGAGDERLAGSVLFAPHHGSRTSSSPALIAAVRPAAVVISDGAGNRFGFPHPEVVARYRRAGSRVYCTGTHGAIVLYSDGQSVRIETFSGDRDEFTARP